LGRVEDDKLSALYRQADFFLLPSRWEGMSISLLEAMASGLPTVGTNVGGNPEMATPDCGILVPPQDPKALASALVKLVGLKRERRLLMGKAARNAALGKFSLSRMCSQYLQEYKRVIR
jgi:glycosyltransferase involved in cell wall biosynthesis